MGRKRKSDVAEYAVERPRNAANERERDRMRVLSRAFSKLKTTLPWVPADTKLSKLDTLRLATCYIGHLRQLLLEDDEECLLKGTGDVTATSDVGEELAAATATVHPINLVSPSLVASSLK